MVSNPIAQHIGRDSILFILPASAITIDSAARATELTISSPLPYLESAPWQGKSIVRLVSGKPC